MRRGRRAISASCRGRVITYWLLVAVLRFRMLASGYADVPLAFFAFAAVYALLLARHAEGAEMRRRYVMVGAVLAAGAALTKQTGLYIVLVYPLLAWLLVLRSGQAGDLRRQAGTLLRAALLAGAGRALVSLQVRRIPCRQGLQQHGPVGRRFPRRKKSAAAHAACREMLVEATTPAGALLLLLAVAAALRDPLERWLVATLVVPLGLVWAAGFSYDLRNLALILPFVGAAAGHGIDARPSGWGSTVGWDKLGGTRLRVGEHGPPTSARSGGPRSLRLAGPTLRRPAYRVRVGHVAGLLALAVAAASLA